MAKQPDRTIKAALISATQRADFLRYLEFIGAAFGPPAAPDVVGFTEDGLSPEEKAILGTPCSSGDCTADQPLCPPNPHITCQLTPDDDNPGQWKYDWALLPWRIVNAQKGDLIMSPGGASGVISTLLSQLQPPQHYSHMGIMTRDQVEVRHATASDDWLQDHPNGHIILDGPEPSDGFQPDALRYGWPGTITQSIDAAYNASLDNTYAGAAITDAGGKSYVISALSFEPSVVNTNPDDSKPPIWTTLQCLVVSPCGETPALRQALHRIADEVLAIRGHYRFFAYSNAAIALDPAYFGPPVHETQRPDPADPCAAPVQVDRTIPVVCSTLIWAAVEQINARGEKPTLFLDGLERDPNRCANTLTRTPEVDNPGGVFDGLFDYDEAERRAAAKKLYQYLHDKVETTVKSKVPGIVKDLGGVILVLSAIMAIMNQSVSLIATALGISAEEVEKLVDWISDMPDDVANQLVNAFAFDWCDTEAKDSDKWKDPGTGRSVSPDNIIRSWTTPAAQSPERMVGLYGKNRRAILRPPQWAMRPKLAWQISAGPSGLYGLVHFQGQPINGVQVRVCCVNAATANQRLINAAVLQTPSEDGVYRMAPPAGDYLASAAWEDPSTGLWLTDEKPVSLELMKTQRLDFDLQPPPAANREVVVTGRMDIVSRVAFGHDWWGHPQFEAPHVRVGPYGQHPDQDDDTLGKTGHTKTSQTLSDYGSVELKVDVTWNKDNTVTISWFAAIFDGDDQKVSASERGIVVPQDGAVSRIVDMVTAGAWPDRAHIEFTIANTLQG